MPYVRKTSTFSKIEELAKKIPTPLNWVLPDPYDVSSYAMPLSVVIPKGVKFLRVLAKDDRTGKVIKPILTKIKEGKDFLTGVEVNKTGEEIFGKGFTERLHVIDKKAIQKVEELIMNLKYGELEKLK